MLIGPWILCVAFPVIKFGHRQTLPRSYHLRITQALIYITLCQYERMIQKAAWCIRLTNKQYMKTIFFKILNRKWLLLSVSFVVWNKYMLVEVNIRDRYYIKRNWWQWITNIQNLISSLFAERNTTKNRDRQLW